MKQAIKKYGICNFEKIVISLFDNIEDLIEAEKNMITFELFKNDMCYNLALGGHGGYTYYEKRKYTHTAGSRSKISKSKLGKKRPDISANPIYVNFTEYWIGKTRTEDDKKRKSEAAFRRMANGTHPSQMKVTCPHCSMRLSKIKWKKVAF